MNKVYAKLLNNTNQGNANKTTVSYHFTPSRMAVRKKDEITSW